MKRKLTALLLTTCMLSVSLTACNTNSGGSSEGTPEPISTSKPAAEKPAESTSDEGDALVLPVLSPDNPITFTVFLPTANAAPAPNNRITQALKDELGVTLELDIISSNYDEKIGVMIASGDYPDIIGNTNTRFVEAGAVMPLNDWLSPTLAGNIFTHVEPVWNKVSYVGDGLIYVLPNYNRFYGDINGGTHYGPGFWIQKDVLAEFDYPEITSLDEYFDIIGQYAAKYPTIEGQPTIGFEICCAAGKEFCLTNAPQHLVGHPNDGGVVVDFDTHVAEIFADKDYAKTYYQYLNDINHKGLLDQETFTQNYDQYLSKLASGRVLGMFDQRWNFGNAHDALQSEGKYERQWVAVMPVYDGYEPYYRDRDVMNINQGYGVSSNTDKQAEAVAFLNELLTEKWQKLINWGVEGVDFHTDDQGRYYRTPEQRIQQDDPVWKTVNRFEAFFDMAPKLQGTYSDGNSFGPTEQPEEFYDSLSDYDKDFLDKYGRKTWVEFLNQPPENPPYYPAWNIFLTDGSPEQMANTQISDLALQYLPRAILADPAEFDAVWEEYCAQIQLTNYKEYEDAINKEIQWRMDNWG